MYYGDLVALVIASFGVGVVAYYTDSNDKKMSILSRVLLSMIVFLWVGFGLLWIN
jgi:hypothetical protein